MTSNKAANVDDLTNAFKTTIIGNDSRASFLGLPSELRVQIYGYVFTPTAETEADDGKRKAFKIEDGKMICECTPLNENDERPILSFLPIPTDILRTNKMIHKEATEVMPKDFDDLQSELRVDLPAAVHMLSLSDLKSLFSLDKNLAGPVRSVTMTFWAPSFVKLLRKLHPTGPSKLENIANQIKADFPSLTELRLCMDIDVPSAPYNDGGPTRDFAIVQRILEPIMEPLLRALQDPNIHLEIQLFPHVGGTTVQCEPSRKLEMQERTKEFVRNFRGKAATIGEETTVS